MSSITYILGYWKIPRNPKRNLTYYKNIMLNTLERLKGKHVVFFYDDNEIFEHINPLNSGGHKIFLMKYLIEDLPTFDICKDLLNSCKNQDLSRYTIKDIEKEKGYVHYNRDYKLSDDNTYHKIITVWTSKLFLIEKIMDLNPCKTDNFAWIDASATRFNVRQKFYETFKQGSINAINTSMQYNGERMFHGATIMIADSETWSWLIPLFKTKLDEVKHSRYAHDEETIMYLIYKEDPERFVKILTMEQEGVR